MLKLRAKYSKDDFYFIWDGDYFICDNDNEPYKKYSLSDISNNPGWTLEGLLINNQWEEIRK